MRVWDEELMLGGTDVVREGLLCWIDFRDAITVTSSNSFGATQGTIRDRVTGSTATITGAGSDNDVIWFEQQNGMLVLHNSTNDTVSYTKKLVLPSTLPSSKTFEVVFNPPTSGKYDRINFIEGKFLKPSQNVIRFFDAFQATDARTGGSAPVHIFAQIGSNRAAAGYVNGSIVASGRAPFDSDTPAFLFNMGLKGADGAQLLRIGSIRVYNHNFNGDELAQNVQYEVETGRLTV